LYAKSVLGLQPLRTTVLSNSPALAIKANIAAVSGGSRSKLRMILSEKSATFRNHVPVLTMSANPAQLFALLDRLQISHRSVSHPPLFTVEQSRVLRGQIPGGHTKNLFLRDRRGFYLVVALEDATIDLKALSRRLGAAGRFSFGSADAMRDLLGVEPGSVTPFAVMSEHDGRVAVVLDSAMLGHEVLNFHPLVNTMTTSISRDGLLAFLRSTGHEPHIAAVAEPVPPRSEPGSEPLAPPP
jgi:Ala-tRNA(Pro) deacylase